jgi:hypothetical protein
MPHLVRSYSVEQGIVNKNPMHGIASPSIEYEYRLLKILRSCGGLEKDEASGKLDEESSARFSRSVALRV